MKTLQFPRPTRKPLRTVAWLVAHYPDWLMRREHRAMLVRTAARHLALTTLTIIIRAADGVVWSAESARARLQTSSANLE